MRPHLPLTCSFAVGLMVLATITVAPVQAQTMETDDYIYIGIEAEDHISKDERWVTTTPTTPAVEDDPDGNHSDGAGGSTYLELLPDIRVTHDDPMSPPTAYWGQPGQGPQAAYTVDIPEPGRYYVHVRAYSTGTEDNGIHIGLNNSWPQSGARMQFCSASKKAWWWSSAQRDSGGNGSCGAEKTIWLDIDTAGINTVNISAREDGFEIDKLVLIKDKSNNTRVCSPVNLNGVNCKNGSIESADGFIDLRVRLSAEAVGADPEATPPSPVEVDQGQDIVLTAKIENLDGYDTANDIVLTLMPVAGDWDMIDMDERCIAEGDQFQCSFDELHPTAPDEHEAFVFTMKSLLDGDNRIEASVLSVDADDTPGNDEAAVIVRSLSTNFMYNQDTDIKLDMSTEKVEYETGDSVVLAVNILNIGNADADSVEFDLTPDANLSLNAQSLPLECTGTTNINCVYNVLAAGATQSLSIEFIAGSAGVLSNQASVSASNDTNASNNDDTDSLIVSDPVVESTTGTDGGSATTEGQTTGEPGATAGETDSASGGGTDSTDAGTDSGTTDNGESSAGSTNGSGSSDTGSTDSASGGNSELGSLTLWLAFTLLLFVSARGYGRHQRQRIAVAKHRA